MHAETSAAREVVRVGSELLFGPPAVHEFFVAGGASLDSVEGFFCLLDSVEKILNVGSEVRKL